MNCNLHLILPGRQILGFLLNASIFMRQRQSWTPPLVSCFLNDGWYENAQISNNFFDLNSSKHKTFIKQFEERQ